MTKVIAIAVLAVFDPVWVILYLVVIGLTLGAIEAWQRDLE